MPLLPYIQPKSGLLSTLVPGGIPESGGLTPQGKVVGGLLADYITGPIHRFYEANNTAVRSLLGGPPMTEEERNKLAEAMVEIMPEVGAITYHGTPHKFAPTLKNALGEFDLSKIGTGEGAQAYGHGIYVADNKDIAKQYRTNTSYNDIKRKFLDKLPEDADFIDVEDLAKGGAFGDKGGSFINELKKDDWLGFDYPSQAISAALSKDAPSRYDLSNDLLQARDNLGELLTVDLPDEHIEKMLDWDKPLSQQPKVVQQNLAEYASADTNKIMSRLEADGFSDGFSISERDGDFAAIDNNANDYRLFPTKGEALSWLKGRVRQYTYSDPLGSNIYRDITRKYGQDSIGQAQASRELLAKGIPGARYLDGSSRGAGQGTSNYVVFDPSILNILSRE